MLDGIRASPASERFGDENRCDNEKEDEDGDAGLDLAAVLSGMVVRVTSNTVVISTFGMVFSVGVKLVGSFDDWRR